MPIDLYRRHSPKCRYFAKGQNYTKCNCLIWCYGQIEGRPIRKALKTRDWTLGLKLAEKIEAGPDEHRPVQTVAAAVKAYLGDCADRKLAASTLTSYRNVLEAFADHCARRNIRDVRGLRLEEFKSFRSHRAVSDTTQRKEIEHLRAFCSYCLDHEWIAKNFAKKVKPPADNGPVTMPYEREEITAMLAACDQITNAYTASAERARKRARALLLLLLYSGLRVSDAVQVRRSQLSPEGRLLVRMEKTNVPLYVRLHRDCLAALRALPEESEYFLWSGKSKLSTATGSARRTVTCISKIAGIPARPHRFRDTFAVELLLAGEDIRTVQMLLGHKSVKTTEKHYAPYVKRFQDLLDAATARLEF